MKRTTRPPAARYVISELLLTASLRFRDTQLPSKHLGYCRNRLIRMGSSVSISQDVRSVGYALTSDKTVAEFFREELDTTVRQRDDHIAFSTLDSTSIEVGAGATNFWEQTFERISPILRTSSRVLEFPLVDLYLFIANQPSLRTAGIVSCSCYSEPTIVRPIPHEFLILQLRREGRPDIWLRLDRFRCPDVGVVKFARTLGTTPSNDKAKLAPIRAELLRSSQFRLKLLEIVTFLDRYKLTSENCWVFCYLLMSALAKANRARFLLGQLCHGNLAQRTEQRLLACRFEPMARALSPGDISQFIPFSLLIGSLDVNTKDLDLRELTLGMLRRWEGLGRFNSPKGQVWDGSLVPSLQWILEWIHRDPNSRLALQTTALCRQIVLCAGASWATIDRSVSDSCVLLLSQHGQRYLEIEPPDLNAALSLYEEATSLVVPGVTENSDVCGLHYRHATILHDLGRMDEAKVVVSMFIESVQQCRVMHWLDKIKDLACIRGIWPPEFDYLVELGNDDVRYWHF